MGKTYVIGLDSIDWKFLDKAISDGFAPNIARIYEDGFHGDLRSIDPPLSVPAWLCFASGKRPDKLDLYRFGYRKPGTYHINSVSGYAEFQDEAFWNDLENPGVIGVPSISPNPEFNGFMVSGPFCPEEACPDEFKNEVEEFGYSAKNPNFWEFEESLKHMEMEGNFMDKVLSRRDPEFFIGVTSVTDRVQHAYCNDEDKMMELYSKADEFAGKILSHTTSEDNVFIVSDHGTAPIKKVFYVNKWLEEKGFLEFNEQGSSTLFQFREDLRYRLKRLGKELLSRIGTLEFAMNNVPDRIQDEVRSKSGVWDKIDWSNTLAYSTGGYVGQIFLNTEDDYPEGQVSEKNYENIREEIIEGLKELEDPEDGEKVIGKIWRKEEIYRDFAHKAPDILFYTKDMSYKVNDGFHGKVFDGSVPNGSHGLNGIILGKGPNIREGEFDMHLTDLAPTLLHLMGKEVPEDMDGSVKKEIFVEGSEPKQGEVRKISEELDNLDF